MSEATKRTRSVAKIIGLVVMAFAAVVFLANLLISSQRSFPLATKNVCINNLRFIDAAKQEWELEKHKSPRDVPSWEDLNPNLSGTNNLPLPKCPSGGTYTLGAVSNRPTCSIPDHMLP